jgi:hypothetical protein
MCSEKNCITEKCPTQFRKGHNSEPENEEVSFGEQRWKCYTLSNQGTVKKGADL